METPISVPAAPGVLIWRDSGHICAVSDDERHLGYTVWSGRWHSYDATKLNDEGNGFKYLGPFDSAAEGKRAVELSIAGSIRPDFTLRGLPGRERNREICRKLRENAIGNGELSVIDAKVSTRCRLHDPAFPSLGHGAAALKNHVQDLRRAFPDLSSECDDIIAERDEVVIHWTIRGTHRGEFLNHAPTGRSIMISGTSIHRLAKGKIVEIWSDWNLQSLIDQLGLGMPENEANKALVARFLHEVWNHRKPEMIGHFVAEDFVRHSPDGIAHGPEGLSRDYAKFVAEFPGCHFSVGHSTCEGTTVTTRFTFSGTNAGSAAETPGIAVYRVANGKIAEENIVWDRMALTEDRAATITRAARTSLV